MHVVPFLRIRGSPEAEAVGLDEFELGENSYDYVAVEREVPHGLERGAVGGGREGDHHHHGKQTPDSSEKQV